MKYISVIIIMISITIPLTIHAGMGLLDYVGPDGGDPVDNLADFGEQAGYDIATGENALPVRIGQIIQVVLGFVGVVFLILIIYSGFQWMMAGGNQDTIGKARQRIINAVIGLVIVLAAYSITWFVTEQILNVTNPE